MAWNKLLFHVNFFRLVHMFYFFNLPISGNRTHVSSRKEGRKKCLSSKSVFMHLSQGRREREKGRQTDKIWPHWGEGMLDCSIHPLPAIAGCERSFNGRQLGRIMRHFACDELFGEHEITTERYNYLRRMEAVVVE